MRDRVHRPRRSPRTTCCYNRNAIFIGGLRPHYYCLPVLKREPHRLALVDAATSRQRRASSSAPTARRTPRALKEQSVCGAGCYTALAALELYAEAFDAAGALDKLEAFASFHGADFYGLPRNPARVTLGRERWTLPETRAVRRRDAQAAARRRNPALAADERLRHHERPDDQPRDAADRRRQRLGRRDRTGRGAGCSPSTARCMCGAPTAPPRAAVKHQALFKRLSIRPMVNLAAGKNSTDIALAVDAIDLVIAERPEVVVHRVVRLRLRAAGACACARRAAASRHRPAGQDRRRDADRLRRLRRC